MMLSFLFLPFALGNGKRKRRILFSFLRKRKKMDGIPLSLLWRNSCQEETKTSSCTEKEGKRRRVIFLFLFRFQKEEKKECCAVSGGGKKEK